MARYLCHDPKQTKMIMRNVAKSSIVHGFKIQDLISIFKEVTLRSQTRA